MNTRFDGAHDPMYGAEDITPIGYEPPMIAYQSWDAYRERIRKHAEELERSARMMLAQAEQLRKLL